MNLYDWCTKLTQLPYPLFHWRIPFDQWEVVWSLQFTTSIVTLHISVASSSLTEAKVRGTCSVSKWLASLTYIRMKAIPFWNPTTSKQFWPQENSWILPSPSCFSNGPMRCASGTTMPSRNLSTEKWLGMAWPILKSWLKHTETVSHSFSTQYTPMTGGVWRCLIGCLEFDRALRRVDACLWRFAGTPTSITFLPPVRHGPRRIMAWNKQSTLDNVGH